MIILNNYFLIKAFFCVSWTHTLGMINFLKCVDPFQFQTTKSNTPTSFASNGNYTLRVKGRMPLNIMAYLQRPKIDG